MDMDHKNSQTINYRKARTDIDIDFKDGKSVIEQLPCTRSVERITEDGLVPHNSGVHFDNIPVDPISGLASIPYKEAERLGYQKVDILSQSAYEHVRDREHLKELMNKEPDWDLLLVPEFVEELSQIKKHITLLNVWRPRSIDELAMFIAMIRPGKRQCQSMNSWDEVRAVIWDYDSIGLDGEGKKLRYFKKPHAYAYSLMIVVQLNALVEYIISSS
ncbi:DNA polymerase [Cronobacter phage vB_CsaM_GAP32]|uniref:Putative membrane protein n=1 Tax=Cronobacter phage vB_CsaM_GAP32 TaxID=1141136 RepID=K4F7I6_9CAUD|nr:DNA polymerase [Cronobacter phage vB_CsaM_GAP32]AFC21732.1 putative membrane protein [Cronobacter phage vB_CsaM_GAP32]